MVVVCGSCVDGVYLKMGWDWGDWVVRGWKELYRLVVGGGFLVYW